MALYIMLICFAALTIKGMAMMNKRNEAALGASLPESAYAEQVALEKKQVLPAMIIAGCLIATTLPPALYLADLYRERGHSKIHLVLSIIFVLWFIMILVSLLANPLFNFLRRIAAFILGAILSGIVYAVFTAILGNPK